MTDALLARLLGKRIRKLRTDRNLTRGALATRMGTVERDVYRLEGAYRGTMPSLRTVMRLAKALRCEIYELVCVLEAR